MAVTVGTPATTITATTATGTATATGAEIETETVTEIVTGDDGGTCDKIPKQFLQPVFFGDMSACLLFVLWGLVKCRKSKGYLPFGVPPTRSLTSTLKAYYLSAMSMSFGTVFVRRPNSKKKGVYCATCDPVLMNRLKSA